MDYLVHIAIWIMIYIILGASLNLILGYTGLFSIVHGALYGLAGYTTGLLLKNLGLNFFFAVPIAVIVTALAASIIMATGLRLIPDYFVLLTFGYQVILYGLYFGLSGITGGYSALSGIPKVQLFGLRLEGDFGYLPLIILLTVIAFGVIWRMTHSPYGRVLKAIREDPDVAASLGKDVHRFKLYTFMMSAAVASLAGAFLATFAGVIGPAFFSTDTSMYVITLVALGGMANLWGTILGAAFVIIIPEILSVVNSSSEFIEPLRSIIFGVLLVLFMIFRPQGMIPENKVFRRNKAHNFKPLSEEEVDHILWEGGTRASVSAEVEGDHTAYADEGSKSKVFEAKALEKDFGGLRAVDGMTLVLEEQKITALIGPNGAGKTTAYNLFTGFIRPDHGSVLFHGRDITRTPVHKIAQMGLVRSFQGNRVLLGMTVLDNVLVARPKQSGEHLWSLFFSPKKVAREEKANLDYAMACLTFVGLADKVGEVANSLSFADQKMLQIACVMAAEAEVVLLDEPVSGVDPAWIDHVLDLIRALVSHGKTVCIIEHNLNVVKDIADVACFLESGRVLGQDTPLNLMADKRLAEIYFGV